MTVITPYHYLLAGSPSPSSDFIEELCTWHNRMVAHLRRHAATPGSCDCVDPDDCPRRQATELYRRAETTFGQLADQLTFLRRHARGDAHG